MKMTIALRQAHKFSLAAIITSIALNFCGAGADQQARAQALNPVVLLAGEMRRSEEVQPRDDYVTLYGKEKVKTYIYSQLSQLPFSKFTLRVEAAGQSGEGRWPQLGIALDDTGKISNELEINHAEFQFYDFGIFDVAGAATLYLVFTNDYYNAATGADVNLRIRQATFTQLAGAEPKSSPPDTFVVKGGSAYLEWNLNSEADLAGYRVFSGLESGTYLSPIEVGKATSYKFDLSPLYKYYFSVAAYDTANNQSPLSKEVLVLVEAAGGGASPSDLNGDGKCDAADQAIINLAMGSSCNGRRYNRKADLNQDCKVDGLDVVLFSSNCE